MPVDSTHLATKLPKLKDIFRCWIQITSKEPVEIVEKNTYHKIIDCTIAEDGLYDEFVDYLQSYQRDYI